MLLDNRSSRQEEPLAKQFPENHLFFYNPRKRIKIKPENFNNLLLSSWPNKLKSVSIKQAIGNFSHPDQKFGLKEKLHECPS